MTKQSWMDWHPSASAQGDNNPQMLAVLSLRQEVHVTQTDVCCCIRDKSSSISHSSFSSCRIIYATNLTANRCYTRTTNHFWFITGDGSKGHTSRHSTFFMENSTSGSQPDQTVLPWCRNKACRVSPLTFTWFCMWNWATILVDYSCLIWASLDLALQW